MLYVCFPIRFFGGNPHCGLGSLFLCARPIEKSAFCILSSQPTLRQVIIPSHNSCRSMPIFFPVSAGACRCICLISVFVSTMKRQPNRSLSKSCIISFLTETILFKATCSAVQGAHAANGSVLLRFSCTASVVCSFPLKQLQQGSKALRRVNWRWDGVINPLSNKANAVLGTR